MATIRIVPIQPTNVFSPQGIIAAIKSGLKKGADVAKADFERSVSTWDHLPVFSIDGGDFEYFVGTDDEIYNYVSGGTSPHTEENVVFNTGYTAKTRVGSLDSGGGGPYGPSVYARAVRNPGITAREFPELVAEDVAPKLEEIISAAISAAL